VPDTTFIGRVRGAGKPSFIDTAAMGTVGVPIVWGELETASRMQKGSRNPSGHKPQQPFTEFQRLIHQTRDRWTARDRVSGERFGFVHRLTVSLQLKRDPCLPHRRVLPNANLLQVVAEFHSDRGQTDSP